MPFLILSHPRSGSSFVNSVVRAHPRVASLQEPLTQHLDMFRQPAYTPWHAGELTEARPHPSIAVGSETDHYLRELKGWLHTRDGLLRGFKETTVFEKLDWMERFFRIDRTILVMRDPRAVVHSVLRRADHGTWWNFAQQFASYREAGGAVTDGVEAGRLSTVVAFLWRLRMEGALERARARGWLVVRLEDLVHDPAARLREIMDYLGVEVHQFQHRFVAASKSESRGGAYSHFRSESEVLESWRSALAPAEQEAVSSIARPVLEQLGYA